MATLAEIQARRYSFRVEADQEAGGWVIWFPDLPGCMSDAETWEEIGPMARDAFEGWTASVFERGLAVPPPRDATGDIRTWKAPAPVPRMSETPTLTASEVAQRLGVSIRRVSALAKSRGTGTKFGRYRLFSEQEVDAMRDRRPGRPIDIDGLKRQFLEQNPGVVLDIVPNMRVNPDLTVETTERWIVSVQGSGIPETITELDDDPREGLRRAQARIDTLLAKQSDGPD